MESLLNHDHGGHTPHTRGPARPRVSETLRTVSPLAQSAPHSGDWIFPAVPVVAMGAGWSRESSSRSPLVRPSFSLNSSKVLPPRVPGDSALSPIGGDQGESEGGGGAAGGRVGVAQDARDEWAPHGNPFLSSGAGAASFSADSGAISFSSGAASFSSGAGAISFSAASKSGATPFFLSGAGATSFSAGLAGGATSFSLGLALGLSHQRVLLRSLRRGRLHRRLWSDLLLRGRQRVLLRARGSRRVGAARQRLLLHRRCQRGPNMPRCRRRQDLGERAAEHLSVEALLPRAPVMQLDEHVRARPMPADVFVHPARIFGHVC